MRKTNKISSRYPGQQGSNANPLPGDNINNPEQPWKQYYIFKFKQQKIMTMISLITHLLTYPFLYFMNYLLL